MAAEFPNDQELHKLARAYALKHGVSYMEALDAVVEDAKANQPAASSARPVSYSEQLGDAKLHAMALEHQGAHSVSYAEAIHAVVDSGGSRVTSFKEAAAAPAMVPLRKPLELLRVGRLTGDDGKPYDLSMADIQRTAAGYSRTAREAPMALGVPQHDQPSFGWVHALQATEDGRLLATEAEVDSRLAELIDTDKAGKKTAAFYPPEHANNPTPGSWYLRHISWPELEGDKRLSVDLSGAQSRRQSAH
ncbi:hypothetical protein GNX71_28690 [Variovorax sp. RKNM96]|uniref:hypothetical protein n=1 Tax=Variovorax sp. RKNM96 TaxID=2681552 RepID=UPI00197DA696|nr:hypothetical protein [Variovorax sp. RKNM96]QSI33328.1 hypothetical protein GNX71_28690 [Variovorax sp. RKNM96]